MDKHTFGVVLHFVLDVSCTDKGEFSAEPVACFNVIAEIETTFAVPVINKWSKQCPASRDIVHTCQHLHFFSLQAQWVLRCPHLPRKSFDGFR